MDTYVYPWICMELHGIPWNSMDIQIYGNLCYMDIHGYVCICMDIHGYACMSINLHVISEFM